jgi:hypothetical protein
VGVFCKTKDIRHEFHELHELTPVKLNTCFTGQALRLKTNDNLVDCGKTDDYNKLLVFLTKLNSALQDNPPAADLEVAHRGASGGRINKDLLNVLYYASILLKQSRQNQQK